ncbi:hypothetical protein TNCV_3029181 [Trichonephila clavipes]|nr:hypothetical protein TNCV_3029181 [Trichonephila clavipes]
MLSTDENVSKAACPLPMDNRPPNPGHLFMHLSVNGHVYYDEHSSSWPSWIVVPLSPPFGDEYLFWAFSPNAANQTFIRNLRLACYASFKNGV